MIQSVDRHLPATKPEFVRGDTNPVEIYLADDDNRGSYHSDSGAGGVGDSFA